MPPVVMAHQANEPGHAEGPTFPVSFLSQEKEYLLNHGTGIRVEHNPSQAKIKE
jgi:hypothetical protein